MQFTILFDPPFYVGVLEQERGGRLYAARVVFGPEPNNEQVYAYVLAHLPALLRGMTAGLAVDSVEQPCRLNPKRQQRAIRRMLATEGVSSRAHEAMRLQHEARKTTRQERSKAERDADRQAAYERKREKARQKRRGH